MSFYLGSLHKAGWPYILIELLPSHALGFLLKSVIIAVSLNEYRKKGSECTVGDRAIWLSRYKSNSIQPVTQPLLLEKITCTVFIHSHFHCTSGTTATSSRGEVLSQETQFKGIHIPHYRKKIVLIYNIFGEIFGDLHMLLSCTFNLEISAISAVAGMHLTFKRGIVQVNSSIMLLVESKKFNHVASLQD